MIIDQKHDDWEVMASLGMDVQKTVSVPKPMTKAEYPAPTFLSEPDFDSFVAYDFETTGLSPQIDSIIEIGAIRVSKGIIVEEKQFIFSEFAKPFQRPLTPTVTEITGITWDDLKDARPMWDVVRDFLNFVGNDILIGYNNAKFDSRFLTRAGRYAHKVIDNPQFDLLQYIRSHKAELGYTREKCNLGTVADFYEIENPAAHRAWADAVTTAKVFLKVREKKINSQK